MYIQRYKYAFAFFTPDLLSHVMSGSLVISVMVKFYGQEQA